MENGCVKRERNWGNILHKLIREQENDAPLLFDFSWVSLSRQHFDRKNRVLMLLKTVFRMQIFERWFKIKKNDIDVGILIYKYLLNLIWSDTRL